ncbi:helix-turn-helix domain-containing protein [Rhodococcus aetherivorans]|uniref:helix-turn-helix domain-containing protein n=1 Tax=Rhodococcus aetherivorans TaxID=191292 RepID=UPI00045D14DB|nr:helix-turn-helix domain-containing protein [Rhodococcus aetherivorans]KDE12429.1 hypothetical protein N505_0115385 [Rhodococcus aetherivorans]
MSAPITKAEAIALLDANSVRRRSVRAVFLQYVKYLNDANLDENGDPIAWPKVATLVKATGYCKRSVQAANAELAALGLIGRTAKAVAATVRHGRAVVRTVVLSTFKRTTATVAEPAPAKGANAAPPRVQTMHPAGGRSPYMGTTKIERPTPTPPPYVPPAPRPTASSALRAKLRTGWRDMVTA